MSYDNAAITTGWLIVCHYQWIGDRDKSRSFRMSHSILNTEVPMDPTLTKENFV